MVNHVPFRNTTPTNRIFTFQGADEGVRKVHSIQTIIVEALEDLAAINVLPEMIPIRKNDAWWQLPQDDRRIILEETSQHIRIGLKYLPNISPKLHHCRDLPSPQPFDQLLTELRATEEWKYVDREIDIRLQL